MNIIDQLDFLKKYATEYRNEAQSSVERNRHMNDIEENELMQQRHIDAVLVDFINYVGVRNGCDYALYTIDLKLSE